MQCHYIAGQAYFLRYNYKAQTKSHVPKTSRRHTHASLFTITSRDDGFRFALMHKVVASTRADALLCTQSYDASSPVRSLPRSLSLSPCPLRAHTCAHDEHFATVSTSASMIGCTASGESVGRKQWPMIMGSNVALMACARARALASYRILTHPCARAAIRGPADTSCPTPRAWLPMLVLALPPARSRYRQRTRWASMP